MIPSIQSKDTSSMQNIPQEKICLHPFLPSSLSGASSIEHFKKESFVVHFVKTPFTALYFLWKKVRDILDYSLFYYFRGFGNSIDWKQTKEAFKKIHQIVLPYKGYYPAKEQKDELKTALSKLSKQALERFKFHIGMARAEKEGCLMTELERAQWYQKNRSSIDFRQDYFLKIGNNPVLETAVRSFWKEIQEHT